MPSRSPQGPRRHPRRVRVALAVCLTAACAVAAPSTAGAATLVGDYRFQNTLASSLGAGAPLTDVGPGTNSYATEDVAGTSRTVLRFPKGNGVRFGTASELEEYTLVILMRFASMQTDYARVTDTSSRAQDEGLYFFRGNVEFYPFPSGSAAIADDDWVEVALTRDSLGAGKVYVNGELDSSFDDAATQYARVTDSINFFIDDLEETPDEDSAGAVSRIRIFDGALTADEIGGLPVATDGDGDGSDDDLDNCPGTGNDGQADLDEDGTGDACDADVDGDGTPNAQDDFPRDPTLQKKPQPEAATSPPVAQPSVVIEPAAQALPPALGGSWAFAQRGAQKVLTRGSLVRLVTGQAALCATAGSPCTGRVTLKVRVRRAGRMRSVFLTGKVGAQTIGAGEERKLVFTMNRSGRRLLSRGKPFTAFLRGSIRVGGGAPIVLIRRLTISVA